MNKLDYYKKPQTQWLNLQGSSKELLSIIPDCKFSYPKSTVLIKKIISLHSNKDALVLDFFAGSGTTGHAVMELNKEDGGNRRFILVTNNELWETENIKKKREENPDYFVNNTGQVNTHKYPELGIARGITRERIFRVINGKGSKNEQIEWTYSKKLKSLENNSVKYLMVKLLDKYKGEYEDLDRVKTLYKKEFNKDLSIKDFPS